MEQDTLLPFDLPAVARKNVSVADGGLLSSDAGVLVLRDVERHLGLATRLAGYLRDRRAAGRIDHDLEEMLRLRMFAIAAGYEDANDCAKLRRDPAFKIGGGPSAGERGALVLAAGAVTAGERAITDARLMVAMVARAGSGHRARSLSLS